MVIEFTLKVEAVTLLKSKFGHVKKLFEGVDINIEESSTSVRTNIIWVSISGKDQELCSKAKKYITSLTNPSKSVELQIKETLGDNEQFLQSIERDTCCVLEKDGNNIVIHSIDELGVGLAQSLVEGKLKVTNHQYFDSPKKFSIITNKLKQYIYKLGFDDTDLDVVINHFNKSQETLNENTLLQELMKNCPQKLKKILLKNEESSTCVEEKSSDFSSIKSTGEASSSLQENITEDGLRDIIIDGSNVAMCHGRYEVFSCGGIEIVVNWFKERGHDNIFVFVPQWRLEKPTPDAPISDQDILKKLQREGVLVRTPSRRIDGRRVVCYDDRFIVKHAVSCDGIIVSNDQYRDLIKENLEWKSFLQQRLLMFTFVRDTFMAPDDPLGRTGPTIDQFLRKGTNVNKICPYKNKCTFGPKCRFYHPEKTKKSVPEITNHSNEIDIQDLNVAYRTSNSSLQQKTHRDEINFDDRNYSFSIHDHSLSKTSKYGQTNSQYLIRPCAVEHNISSGTSVSNYYLTSNDVIARGQSYQPMKPSLQQPKFPNVHDQFATQNYRDHPNIRNGDMHMLNRDHCNLHHGATNAMAYRSNYDNSAATSLIHPSTPSYLQYSTGPSVYSNYIPPNSQFGYTGIQSQNVPYHIQSSSTHSNHNMAVSNTQPIHLEHRDNFMIHNSMNDRVSSQNTHRSHSVSTELSKRSSQHEQIIIQKLNSLFPGRKQIIQSVLKKYPNEMNLNVLASYIASVHM